MLHAVAGRGPARVHRVLVDEYDVEVDEYLEFYVSMLGWAVRRGDDLDWVRFCFERGADPNRCLLDEYLTFLAEAAGEGILEVMKLLLEYGAKREGSGALVFAAENGHVEATRFLLQEDVDINEVGIACQIDPRTWPDVGTALHKAIEGHPEVVDLLLETDMTVRDGRGRTPLELAEQFGRTAVVEKLKALRKEPVARRDLTFTNMYTSRYRQIP